MFNGIKSLGSLVVHFPNAELLENEHALELDDYETIVGGLIAVTAFSYTGEIDDIKGRLFNELISPHDANRVWAPDYERSCVELVENFTKLWILSGAFNQINNNPLLIEYVVDWYNSDLIAANRLDKDTLVIEPWRL